MNSIDIRVQFSFKGKTYELGMTLDLDTLGKQQTIPSLHQLLARQHGIDPYSYLYEVMEVSEIKFANPQGLAKDFCAHKPFEPGAYFHYARTRQTQQLLHNILTEELSEPLPDCIRSDILRAMARAYQAGSQQEHDDE